MEPTDLARIFFALMSVLGLIGVLAFAARKTGLSTGGVSFARKRRLSAIETLNLDPRRKLALVRCDEKEYLLVLGPTGETVVARDLDPIAADEETPERTGDLATSDRGANPFAALYAGAKQQQAADAA
ncbi:MAG: flagellar biosynthetic protein FliO [Pseudomonadota bacterium]